MHPVTRTQADLTDAAKRITKQLGSSVQINFQSFDPSQSQDFDAIFTTCDPIYILVKNADAISYGTL